MYSAVHLTMALSPEKREARKGFFVVWRRSNRSALKVSLFLSRNPSTAKQEGWREGRVRKSGEGGVKRTGGGGKGGVKRMGGGGKGEVKRTGGGGKERVKRTGGGGKGEVKRTGGEGRER